MATDEWDDADIARASEALDAELDKIFRATGGVPAEDEPAPEDNIPEAEILPDDDDDLEEDYEAPEAFIIDGDDDDIVDLAVAADDDGGDEIALPGPISREELAAIIETAVERGILAALKKLGKF